MKKSTKRNLERGIEELLTMFMVCIGLSFVIGPILFIILCLCTL